METLCFIQPFEILPSKTQVLFCYQSKRNARKAERVAEIPVAICAVTSRDGATVERGYGIIRRESVNVLRDRKGF